MPLPHPQPVETLRCRVVPDRETAWVRPAGELDLATVGHVEAALRGARDAGFQRLVLDLRELTFMDSTGVRLVLTWAQEAQREGFELAVGRSCPAVMRVFELTGLERALPWTEEPVH